MKNYKVEIPKPCYKDWNSMNTKDTGRHCHSCNTTVVDFSSMTTEEIKNYFDKTNGTKVCGYFNTTQTQTPALHRRLLRLYEHLEQNISIRFFRTIPLGIIALCMIMIGCQKKTMGETISQPSGNNPECHSSNDTTVHAKKDCSNMK